MYVRSHKVWLARISRRDNNILNIAHGSFLLCNDVGEYIDSDIPPAQGWSIEYGVEYGVNSCNNP